MAADMTALIKMLGHRRVSVVGHDRGSYVTLRMALDAPELVDRLAVLDSVPISEALDRADARSPPPGGTWLFHAQPDTPERVILADRDA